MLTPAISHSLRAHHPPCLRVHLQWSRPLEAQAQQLQVNLCVTCHTMIAAVIALLVGQSRLRVLAQYRLSGQLKHIHRCSEKVDDVLMFSGGVDRLQSGSIAVAELRRLLHCCGFHSQDDGYSVPQVGPNTGSKR